MTDNRLAEADRVPVEQAGKIWRITGIKSFKGEGGNFKLDASVDGRPVKFLQNGGTRIRISFACNNTSAKIHALSDVYTDTYDDGVVLRRFSVLFFSVIHVLRNL